MKFLTVDTLEIAREKLLQHAFPTLTETVQVPLEWAAGRVLAVDIYSSEAIPDFRRSTVDGYAVKYVDTQGAGESIPVFLDIIEEIAIGSPAQKEIMSGQCAYVPTGGMVPDGADAMVMIEYTELLDSTMVAVYEAVSSGRGVVQVGEDARQEELLLTRGTMLTPKEIGVLASLGMAEITVYRPWNVTIISTGDELCRPGEEKGKCQIYDVNRYTVGVQAKHAGMDVVRGLTLKDEEAGLEQALRTAMAESDLVVLSGGSSQGKKDMTADLIEKVGNPGVWTHGIALKPGKPTIIGSDDETKTLFIGLPGHPVAAMMVFELLILWLQRQLQGQPEANPIPAKLESNIPAAAGRATCQMVKLLSVEDGYLARPIYGKSGLMSSLTQADGYVMLPVNQEGLQTGTTVYVNLL